MARESIQPRASVSGGSAAATSPLVSESHEESARAHVRQIVRDTTLPRAAIGAGSGLVATGAMTVAMLALQQMLPKWEQYPLPPRRIVDVLARWLGLRRDLDKTELNALTAVAHFGYGTSMGALYGPIGLALPLPGVVTGILWGLLVWAGSYLGVLPALGILRPATKHPAARNALMIAAHLVWGSSLGALTSRIASWTGLRSK